MKKVDKDIWVIETKLKFMGADFGNRMTIIQLDDGSLLLHSPIKFSSELYAKIKKLGDVSFIITPNLFHGKFVNEWLNAFPLAKHYSPDESKNSLPLSSLSILTASKGLEAIHISGLPKVNEYAFIHKPSKTLILTDIAFNVGSNVSLWTKLFFKLNNAYNKFGPTRLMKSMLSDPYSFKLSMEEILSFNIDRVIVSHGNILEEQAKKALRSAFEPCYPKKQKPYVFSRCG